MRLQDYKKVQKRLEEIVFTSEKNIDNNLSITEKKTKLKFSKNFQELIEILFNLNQTISLDQSEKIYYLATNVLNNFESCSTNLRFNLLQFAITILITRTTKLNIENIKLKERLLASEKKSKTLVEKLNKILLSKTEKKSFQFMTAETYQILIKSILGQNYKSARLRIAMVILLVTGIPINQLLSLKVFQLQSLFDKMELKINCLRKDPNIISKAFLSSEGKRIIQSRKNDFELLTLPKQYDSYIFTSSYNHAQPLARESMTKLINKSMKKVSDEFSDQHQQKITIYNFRDGYIQYLWQSSNDIKFVQQALRNPKKFERKH